MFESRLKSAGSCFTDPEASADLALICATNFHLRPALLCEECFHGALGEFGSIAIAAEMAKHDALNFAGQQLLDHGRGGSVREMTMTRHDPLFDRPGPLRTALQKFLVVFRLDHERVDEAKSLHHQFGRVPEIGDETKPRARGMKSVTDRVDRVMRHRKTLDCDIANRKLRASAE